MRSLTPKNTLKQEKLHRERAEYMKNLVLMNKDVWTHEYEFWKETGKLRLNPGRPHPIPGAGYHVFVYL